MRREKCGVQKVGVIYREKQVHQRALYFFDRQLFFIDLQLRVRSADRTRALQRLRANQAEKTLFSIAYYIAEMNYID